MEPERAQRQWLCGVCKRAIEGEAPTPRVCYLCPEPRLQAWEADAFTNDDGSLKSDAPRIEECKHCQHPIRRNPRSRVLPGNAQCFECALSRKVKCGHPAHRGGRDVLVRDALRGLYVHETPARRIERHDRVICLKCFQRSGAMQVHEAVTTGDMTALPFDGETFTLDRNPREKYPVDAAIFDAKGIDAVGERHIVRFHSRSYQRAYWQNREVSWIECSRFRLTPSGNDCYEDTDAIIINRAVARVLHLELKARRRAHDRFASTFQRTGHKANAVTLESLGWVIVQCDRLDETERPVYSVTYPDVRHREATREWAYRVLK